MTGVREAEKRPTRVWGAGEVPASAVPDRRSWAGPGQATKAWVASRALPTPPGPIAGGAPWRRWRRWRRWWPRRIAPGTTRNIRSKRRCERLTRGPVRSRAAADGDSRHRRAPAPGTWLDGIPAPRSPLPSSPLPSSLLPAPRSLLPPQTSALAAQGGPPPAALHFPPVSPPRGRVGQQRHASSRRRPRETRGLTARPFPSAALRRPARTARAARPACPRAGTPRPSDRPSGPPIRTGAPEPAPWKTSATRSNTSRP